MKMFDATEVVPVNFVFFTTSAIVAGASAVKPPPCGFRSRVALVTDPN